MVLFEDDMDAHFESARFGVDEGKLIWLLLRSVEFEGDKWCDWLVNSRERILTSSLLLSAVTAVLHSGSDYQHPET